MNVFINGCLMDANVDLQGATTTDCAGGQADTSEIILPDAALLNSWEITRGMTLEIEQDGYSTGEMHIDDVLEKPNGTVAIRAVSLSEKARTQDWACFENITLEELARKAASDLGLKYALYGVNSKTLLRRVVRRNQTWPAFLAMVFRNESATIKFDNGTLLAIDYQWAFTQNPARVMKVDDKPNYFQRPRFRTACVRSGLIRGMATDTAVTGSMSKNLYDEQIYGDQQAIRAAKGVLMAENLDGEVYRKKIPFDTSIAAMSRIDLFGHSRITGNWFVSSVTHDFKAKTTDLLMKRCITTIK